MFKLCILFTFSVSGFLHASDIVISRAMAGEYEPEKYLASQYLVTNLHLSATEGKRPLLLILGGSDGNFSYRPGDERIKDFLDRGYHVLEAAYFFHTLKINDIPNKLSQIRLESFSEAIEEYLKSDATSPYIDPDLIGVMGTSKGGELAMLLGSHYPQFKFVIGVVPSHVIFQGSNTTLYHYSSWTLGGKELPFVPFPNFSLATIWGVLTQIFCKSENVNFTWMHSQALKNTEAVEKALIKVENINGPILLVSGLSDQWWPSADMSRMVMERLAEKKFPHTYVHFECDTDHYPFNRKPEVWEAMLEQMDKMVQYSRTFE